MTELTKNQDKDAHYYFFQGDQAIGPKLPTKTFDYRLSLNKP